MRLLYFFTKWTLLTALIILTAVEGRAQCPNALPNGVTGFDTTIATPPGVTTMHLAFPQMDPQNGMITCVRLCVSITGVVDTMSIENTSASLQTADVYYMRTDNITGPGLLTPMTNNLNKHYGTYNLSPDDGNSGSGPDFVSVSKDTLLNGTPQCRTLDTTMISQFYGTDSVRYTYDISALTSPVSSGNYSFKVGTSAFARFHFEYCTCPAAVLPLNIKAFDVTKISNNKVDLKWTGYDEVAANYYYEGQVSRDGHNFISVGVVAKNSAEAAYKLRYETATSDKGLYYFRIRQVYASGYVRYSNIRQISMESSGTIKFSVYPNPSNGIVGIKFDNISDGQFDLQIYNTQGQVIKRKDIVVSGSSYVEVAKLMSGVYWLRLTDKKTLASSVNQLLIK